MTKIKMNIEPVLRCLPKNISAAAAKYEATEIRLLAGRPAMLYTGTDGFFVTSAGDITTSEDSAVEMTKTGVGEVFRLACDNSVYSFEDEIKNGFLVQNYKFFKTNFSIFLSKNYHNNHETL